MVIPVVDMRKVVLVCSVASSFVFAGASFAVPHFGKTGLDNKSIMFHPVQVPANAPLGDRYIAAGDQAHVKGDDAAAKKYWLAALTEYEKHKGQPGGIGLFPSLEHRLLEMYPRDWSQSDLKGSALVAAQEEQVSVYERINKLMQPYLLTGRNNMIGQVAQSRLQQASKDLKATKDQLANNNKAPSTK
jgi:hypothetical protein